MEQRARLRVRTLEHRIKTALAAIHAEKSGGNDRLDEALNVLTAYDELAGTLYEVRRALPPTDPFRVRLEDLVSGVVTELITFETTERKESSYRSFIAQYRRVWREHFSLFIYTVCLFLGSGLVGWNIGVSHPELVPVIVPQQLMEQVIDQEAWFARLQENPLMGGLEIAWNNIRVTVNCFIFGAVLGLGGVALLCFNGVFFGALLGFCAVNDFHSQLTNFVVTHGPLELTVIVAGAFGSLIYGQVFFMRPYKLFQARLREAAKHSGYLILGVTPWLILAAFMEAFVSPYQYLSLPQKIVVGLACALLFWTWTFKRAAAPAAVQARIDERSRS